ncbi:hypothetical protein OsJ_36180 [Oryza sativa Japonica Group]|uniref:HAT C-terminal dimerisation domain-containing protein n=2 Tax=Oryza sativa subsp. japonica TaxID=39947 RepID=A0A8J8XYZ5_ORYSJ|nr:hAT family dimerisation domain containing protein [Oryza sativa Japonica Group]EAZ20571.1 hypothetical protein OsJ_36180 [Oryza sativa Japonica Group]
MAILEPNFQCYIGGYVVHQRCIYHTINLIVQAEHDQTLDGENVDLLEWWKEKERTLCVQAQFERDIILVLASAMSSEHAFSEVGRIIDEQRSCVAPETVEAIYCLKDWMDADVIYCLKDWMDADARTQHRLEDTEIADAAADALTEFGINTDGNGANQN